MIRAPRATSTSDRTRYWADVEAMVSAGTLDVDEVRKTVQTMLADDDPRFARLDDAVRRGAAHQAAAAQAAPSARRHSS